ncbi:MAG: ABC transporter permease [Thermoprotei archaeon]|nr:MAG: ABC transporter permease [Thermoprotei archaeon]
MTTYARYLLGRAITLAFSVWIAISIVFIIPRLVPGNPMDAILMKMSQMGASVGAQELVEEYKKIFGLDKDLFTQYISFIKELLRGNLGYSIGSFPTTVAELISRSIPWTIGLLSVTTILSWIIGTILGALIGWKGEHTILSRLFSYFALLLYVIPYYIFAILLLFFFSYYLRQTLGFGFPSSGGFTPGIELKGFTLEYVLDIIWHSILPALSIILTSLGWWYLSMRSMMTTVKGEDYILMAEAKGLSEKTIMWKYAFRNAILPQTTGLAIALSRIVGGALLTEVIFAYPGMGWLLYNAIKSLDYPLIQGCVLLIILSVALANFIIDLVYPLIDPRIRYGEET